MMGFFEEEAAREEWRHGFAERLLVLMENRGMNEAELRRRADVSKSMLYYYLHGHSEPTGYVIVRLCRALGVSADVLLGIGAGDAE